MRVSANQLAVPLKLSHKPISGRLRRKIFGINPREIMLSERGIVAKGPARERLEAIGQAFVDGYHAGLECGSLEYLAAQCDQVDRAFCGFAYEGAAMALYLRDQLIPGKRDLWRKFLTSAGAAHIYMLHVGAGWAMARSPFRFAWAFGEMDPLLRWLAIDGYAFHEAYFHTGQAVRDQQIPACMAGYMRRAWDMGLGRGMWFAEGADVCRLIERVSQFRRYRQGDLWSGIGLACAYAGGVDEVAVQQLRESSEEYLPQFAQGISFAAKTRERAGNPTPHTELACQLIWEISAAQTAAITDEALVGVTDCGHVPAFETWRKRIQSRFEMNSIRC